MTTLFEWFTSPIIYKETAFADKIRNLMMKYFSTKKSLYQYISMAEGNYREYLKGEKVRAKKYFYVLRPVLACRWILEKGTPPPMLFEKLMDAELPEGLQKDVEKLLNLKMNLPEIREIDRMDGVNEYLDREIVEIKEKVKLLNDGEKVGWEELNQVFLEQVL